MTIKDKLWHVAFVITVWAVVALAVGLVNIATGKTTCRDDVCSMPNMQPPQRQTQREKPYPALVVTEFIASGGSESAVGSGVIVERNGKTATVLTCAHGYKMPMRVFVRVIGGKRFEASIIGVDAVQDVMVLKISDPGIKPQPVAREEPHRGERVYACGFGHGSLDNFTGSWGINAKWLSPDGGGSCTFIETTCYSPDGSSGGPILNGRGQVIGLITGGGPQRMTCGPCLPRVRKLLQFLLPPYPNRPGIFVATPPKLSKQPTPRPLVPVANPTLQRLPNVEASAEAVEEVDGGTIALMAEMDSLTERLNGLSRDVAASAADGPLQSQINRLGGALPGLQKRIEAAETTAAATPGLERIREVAHAVAVGVVSEKAPEIAASAGPIATGGLSAVLTALGVSVPVAGVGGLLAVWLAKRGVRRIIRTDDGTKGYVPSLPHPIDPPPIKPTVASAAEPVVIRHDTPPPPQQVVTERTFVPYATSDPQLKAMLWGQEELVRRNPGARATVDTIAAFAKQHLSGQSGQT